MNILKGMFIISVLITVIICVSSVSAANDTIDNSNNILTDAGQDYCHEATCEEKIADDNAKDIEKLEKSNDTIKEAANNVVVTNTNYNQYFKTNNVSFIPESTTSIHNGDTVYLRGVFENVDFVVDKCITLTRYDNNTLLNNCTVYVNGQNSQGSTISHLTIRNILKEDTPGIFVNYSSNLLIENNHVVVDDCDFSFAFAGSLNNSILRNNYFETASTTHSRTHTSCVMGKSFNNLITNNTVKSDEADGIYFSSYGSGRFIMAGPCSYNNVTYNNLVGGDGMWVNLIQTNAPNNLIAYNNITGGFECIRDLSEGSTIINNTINGGKNMAIGCGSDGLVANNTINTTGVGITIYGANTLVTQNRITTQYNAIETYGNDIYLQENNITSTNGYGFYAYYSAGTEKNVNIFNNNFTTKREGILLKQASITKKINNVLIDNNSIISEAEYAVNLREAGSNNANNVNVTVTTNNNLISKRGSGYRYAYLPPTNQRKSISLALTPVTCNYGEKINITVRFNTTDNEYDDGFILNEGSVTFDDNYSNTLGTVSIIDNQATLSTRITDLTVTEISATFSGTGFYQPSSNTTSATVNPISLDYAYEIIRQMNEENKELNNNLTTQENTINEQAQTIDELNNTIHEQLVTIEELLNTNYTQVINQLNNQIQQQNTTINELNQLVEQQDATITSLNRNIEQKDNTIALLTGTIENQSRTIQELEGMINQLEENLESMENELNEANIQISDLNNTVSEQEEHISNLENNITEANNKINELNTTIQEQTETINTLNQTILEQQENITNLENNLIEANNKINELNTTIQELNNTLQEKTEIINTLNQTIEEKNIIIEQQNNTIQEQMIEINNLNELIENLNSTNYTETIQNMQNTIYELNMNILQLNQTIQNLENNNEILNNTIQQQTTQINNLNNTVNTQTQTIQQQNQTITQLEQNITTQENTINKQAQTIEEQNNTIQTQQQTIQTQNQTITQLEQNITTQENTINKQAQTIEEQNNTIQTQQQTIQNLENNNNELNTTIQEQQQTINTQNKTIEELTDTTQKQEEIINTLNATLQENNKDCIIVIDSMDDTKFNDDITLKGKLLNNKGNAITNTKVTLNFNGNNTTLTTDDNGIWSLKTKARTLGTNNVTASYTGSNYNPSTSNTTFNVQQTQAIVTIDKIVTTQFRDNVTITGTFKNSNGKAIANSKVKVTVNGYSTYVTTDHDGGWTLTLRTNKTGVNNVTASFSGNANYAKYTANTTFNVTKQDLIITTEVKFSKGNFTITGTFVDKNGNKLANSKVRVNINSKAVYVKTDSNGTYTYSELITAKTVKYNVYYGGSGNYNSYTSSKTTITVA